MRLFPAVLHPFPWGLILFGLAVLFVVLYRRAMNRLKTLGPGPWCRGCGYCLHARDPLPGTCPECGLELSAGNVIEIAQLRLQQRRNCGGYWTAFVLAATTFVICWLPICVSTLSDYTLRRQYTEQVMLDPRFAEREYNIFIVADGLAWFAPWHLPQLRSAMASPTPLGNWTSPLICEVNGTRAKTRLIVERPTLAWRIILLDGRVQNEGTHLDVAVIETWLRNEGLDRNYPQATEESAFILAYLTALTSGSYAARPTSSVMMGSGHTPVGSHEPGRSIFVLLPTWILALAIGIAGQRRIDRIASIARSSLD